MGNRDVRPVKGLTFNYYLRLTLFPLIAKALGYLGVPWKVIGERFGLEALIAQGHYFKGFLAKERTHHPLKISIFTMTSSRNESILVELAIGVILRARGHHIRYVIDDQICNGIDEITLVGEESFWESRKSRLYAYALKLFEAFDFEIVSLSELVSKYPSKMKWPEYVEASLLRVFKVGVLDESPYVEKVRRMFEETASISESAGNGMIAMNTDIAIMSHGIYSMWGPAFSVCKENGLPVLLYGRGKKAYTQKFQWNRSADWWEVSREWEKVKDIPLTQKQERKIDNYLETRRTHSADRLVYNFGQEETIEQSRERLNLDPNKQTFVLFTNVLWDAASAQREVAFNNPIEWVLETIKWFVGHPDKQLVVKIHPAEVVIGTKQPFESIIKEHFQDIPSNVRVICPEEKVNSWSILRIADLGLVHTSTIGMELPLEGIPCAVVSRTHYRDKGFTIDINSSKDYFELIETWDGGHDDADTLKVLSKRYFYLLFERFHLPWDFAYCRKDGFPFALNIKALKNFESDSVAKILIDGIENQKDFFLPVA